MFAVGVIRWFGEMSLLHVHRPQPSVYVDNGAVFGMYVAASRKPNLWIGTVSKPDTKHKKHPGIDNNVLETSSHNYTLKYVQLALFTALEMRALECHNVTIN